jgi:uncharacterized delta-60 repeat protein
MAMIALLLCWNYRARADASPGDLDQDFGNGGIVLTDFAPGKGMYYECANALAVQSDGKLVAAGMSASSDFALARYNPDGSLDLSFGSGGKVITDMGGFLEQAVAVGILPDGRIVVVGGRIMSLEQFAMACYKPDGSLDTSFGDGGKVNNRSLLPDEMAVQSDGRIVVAGLQKLVRYNPDGTPDLSFGSGGEVNIQFSGAAMTLQSDGCILLAGGLSGDFALARLFSDGSLDPSFGNGGVVRTDLLRDEAARCVAVAPDGRIVAAGYSRETTNKQPDQIVLVRYNSDGSLDTSFGDGGKVTTMQEARLSLTGLVLQPDGGIVVSKESEDFELIRYNRDGSLDYSFGSNGLVTTDFFEQHDTVQALTMVGNDRLVAAGTSWIPDERGYALESRFALACYMTTGTIKEPGFELGFANSVVQARRGKKVTVTISVNRSGGFTDEVTVTPPDLSAERIICTSPDPKTTSGREASWKFKVKARAAPGPHQLTFVGRDATGRERVATVTLLVD